MHALVLWFDGVNAAILKRTPAAFNGQSKAARRTRRKRHWIEDVEGDA